MRSMFGPPLIAGGAVYGTVSTRSRSRGSSVAGAPLQSKARAEDVWVSLGNGKAVKVPHPRTMDDVRQAIDIAERSFEAGRGVGQSFGATRNTSAAPDRGMLITQLAQLARSRGYGQEWIDELQPDGSSYKGADFGAVHSQNRMILGADSANQAAAASDLPSRPVKSPDGGMWSFRTWRSTSQEIDDNTQAKKALKDDYMRYADSGGRLSFNDYMRAARSPGRRS